MPEAWKAQGAKEAERRELLGEWRQWLGSKQQEVLEENPLTPFQSRIPVEVLQTLTRAEQDELMASEEQAYNSHKPLAREKDERRRAFVQAGGDPEAFEASWEGYGEHMHLEDVAAANRARAAQSSPYS